MTKMNQEVKNKWITALRSGEYKQGASALRYGDRYCCLGVLCELAVQANIIPTPEIYENQYSYNHQPGLPPKEVIQWAEIDIDVLSSLALRNDINGWKFDKIAGWIERNL